MRHRFIYIVIFTLLVPNFIFASGCLELGYTITTINGIFTDEREAKENLKSLKSQIKLNSYNNQPLIFDYLYNPSHLAGLGDLTDAINQGLFDQQSDYDLMEILNDASQKVKTQKLLLVAHSQGNFYSNSFYDQVASQEGGIPSQSIGVYGVASPADRVAGGGKYLTSDTDKVIASTVNRFLNILTPNIHISLKKEDGNGHSFSDVYLKYQGNRIVSDIKSSLSKLENNDEQLPQDPCIAPPELTLTHKITGGIFMVADPLAVVTKNVAVGTVKTSYRFASLIGNGVLGAVKSVASIMDNSEDKNSASVILATESSEQTESASEKSLPGVTVNESKKENTESVSKNISEPVKEVSENTTPLVSDPDISQEAVNTISSNPTSFVLYGSMVPIEPPVTEETPTEDVPPDDEDDEMPPAEDPVVEDPVTEEDPEIDEEPIVEDPVIDNTPPVITILGNNLEIITKNSEYIDAGATALDEIDGELIVETTGLVDTTTPGSYTITYTATDANNNTSTETRTVKVSSYIYVPKYTFGTENGDGNNWQAWQFNGSYVYNWSNTYVNGYLRQQFNIQNFAAGWCSNCLQRGIFNHDPQQGFETTDIVLLSLISGTSNPQNHNVNTIFYVDTQWDANGYSYSILDGEEAYDSGRVDISGVNENMWIGWNGTFNKFTTFPSGSWMGVLLSSIGDLTGGSDMVLQPYPVYDPSYTPPSDTTPPVISSLSVSPNSGYVKIDDTITLTIIADSAGYTAQTISINNVTATDFTDNGDGTYTAIYTVISGDTDRNTGDIPVSVILSDASGNLNDAYTIVEVNTLKVDANAPTLISGEVTSETTVDLTFSEDLNGQTITNADFSILGHDITSPDAFEVIAGAVRLTITDTFTTGETPEVSYNNTVSNGVKDLAGNIAPETTIIPVNNL
ncbi:hypothetical protein COU49_00745 [Candidatus Nomurabacteria bacterium CG10_big_fil_rev_8_21_14_0_10_35_16]|uniref:Uncharacterized protein n=1 Tax=Candidatus Nomurabacteria bacterium CG10_big_fil_rev_8_21_14_0_10_35_16 TaxID=1974731 RepID=A0A2H0TE38_9BACT|nr:MAG: hypothetical protein COU49_00745 [Candidatus Nomurabacteria bacterium CG10_big_fil_rev_8_21_14_0_10_35_16]